MELTVESALSPGGLVGHASYLLLVISMLMRSMTWLRLLVIASAFTAIAYDTIWLKDPVGVFWESLLVTVNIIQIAREWMRERRTRFSPEEAEFVRARLGTLSKFEARKLLNMGIWADAEAGVTLTHEGQAVDHLAYIVAGRVDIFLEGRKVGACLPGNFVGEMSVMGRRPASATAVVAEPTRYWLIPTQQINVLQDKEPGIANVFQAGIARDLRNKIVAHNVASATETG